MELSLLVCPSCGAPLEPHAIKTVVICKHCGASVARGIHDVKSAKFKKAMDGARRETRASEQDVIVGGRRYQLEGRIGRGESSDVFLGRAARRSSSTVLVKILHASDDADLLEREYRALGEIVASTVAGAPFFSQLVPYPLHAGPASWNGGDLGYATVYRAASGFVHTLDDVRAAFPSGVDPRHAVWIFKRTLEVLGFLHAAGWVHGAILPQHIVVHAKGHAAMLIGFSCAVANGARAIAFSEAHKRFYPAAVPEGAPLTRSVDIVMAARSMAHLLGASDDFTMPGSVPVPLAEVITRCARADSSSFQLAAGELVDQVSNAAFKAFGPPNFVSLEMPESQP